MRSTCLAVYRDRFGYSADDFPAARDCDRNTMAIPLHNRMSEDDYDIRRRVPARNLLNLCVGIAGILRSATAIRRSPVFLRRMATRSRIEGRMVRVSSTDGPLGLGHRRLSIIDLSSGGHQPMLSNDGRSCAQLQRRDLQFSGIASLSSKCWVINSVRGADTEVLLNALIQWGEAALSRLNGMFAFAFWDKRERTLLLARDRYGVKPLYYTWQQGQLCRSAPRSRHHCASDLSRRVWIRRGCWSI